MTEVAWPPAKKPNNRIQALFMIYLLQNGFLHLKFSLLNHTWANWHNILYMYATEQLLVSAWT